MGRRRPVTEEELDRLAESPQTGDVWWCDGGALGLGDGDKTRPVLVIGVAAEGAEVIPLTSRRGSGAGIPVRHRAGVSWMTDERPRRVPVLSLLSTLGGWAGFAVWRNQSEPNWH